jgi:hypothetical protein
LRNLTIEEAYAMRRRRVKNANGKAHVQRKPKLRRFLDGVSQRADRYIDECDLLEPQEAELLVPYIDDLIHKFVRIRDQLTDQSSLSGVSAPATNAAANEDAQNAKDLAT